MVTDACHEFKPSTAEDPPCRGELMHVKSVEAQTSTRWCGVEFRRVGCHLGCHPRHLTMVQKKVTLLFFKIITFHNHAPLRSVIYVLKTLQEALFWDGVQKPRHVSLDVRNIVKHLSF
ncbi:hypothetical protein TNCV_988551 [Trichonephila clavipes]|nr:hypothetical protein TNCV_988551 [Trichonephila clavipes]